MPLRTLQMYKKMSKSSTRVLKNLAFLEKHQIVISLCCVITWD